MKKELLKGFAMILLVVAIATVSAVAVSAQSARKVMADVPFDFIVGDQTLNAGAYTLKATTAPDNGLIIQKSNGKSAAARLTFPIEARRNQRSAKLVFHQYGQRYFLAEVWTGAGDSGRHLLKSRQERAIERELGSIASARSYEIVEVVAVLR